MAKKSIGKGLKALIPDQVSQNVLNGQDKQYDTSKVSDSNISETAETSNGETGNGASENISSVNINREPDPFFVENLKKERERRVRAISAMNELIKKYSQ